MSHEWDSGFMVRKPSWHRLENAVLEESPRTWSEARQIAGLTWEVETAPVYRGVPDVRLVEDQPGVTVREDYLRHEQIEGWQLLTRDDTHDTLSVQPTSYEVISNSAFGGLIEIVLGLEGDEYVEFEALMSLYGGRQIIALVRFPQPLVMPFDNSKTYQFCAFTSRHDGTGGLRGLPTNVRVQCANTIKLAEQIDGTAGFTIRHTSNWNDRIAEVRSQMIIARGESERWRDFAEQLALWKVNQRQRTTFLKRFLPISDDMGTRQATNREIAREKVREILASPSCEHIADTGYGLLMAATEWSDHYREARTDDSYVARQLISKEPNKVNAARIVRQMAGIS